MSGELNSPDNPALVYLRNEGLVSPRSRFSAARLAVLECLGCYNDDPSSPGVSAARIARCQGADHSTVNAELHRLERAGVLERRPEGPIDGRYPPDQLYLLSSTPQGQGLAETLCAPRDCGSRDTNAT